MNTTTIGMDLGVTASTQVAVADGARLESTTKVASNPAALVAALRTAAVGRPVNIVLESTAMAWFVAGVAAVRAGVDHTLYRVSGRKAAALRAFYRAHTKTDRIDASVLARMPLVDDGLEPFTLPTAGELALKRLVVLRHRLVRETTRIQGRIRSLLHWAAPGMLAGRDGINDGFIKILARWPDLRQLARARVTTIAKTGQLSKARAQRLHDAARDAVAFYDGFVDFGTLALEGGPIFWVATHRIHHQKSDREGDPHTPREGTYWAHMGWIMTGQGLHHDASILARYVPDLCRDRVHIWLSNWHWISNVVVGLGLLAFGGIPYVLWGIFFRTTFGLHATWLVNSATHLWGSRRFQTRDDSTNNWWVALLTFGEGWHNNHHAHPVSARHGLAWYELDINWIMIRTLERLGVAWDVKVARIAQPAAREDHDTLVADEAVA